ncbi:MAG: hypothetical protein WDN04_18710 [Rhodospirillales bacterium]
MSFANVGAAGYAVAFSLRGPRKWLLGAALAVPASGPATAQTVVIPAGTQPAIVYLLTGPVGQFGSGTLSNPQPGGPGGTIGPLDVTLSPGAQVQSGGAAPSVNLSLAGGAGGGGNEADTDGHGGNGGEGGTPGLLTLTLDQGSSINSTSTAAAAVQVQSLGGIGGNPGGYAGNYGHSGSPGDGGAAGDVVVNLSGGISSSNGWAGATPGTTALAISAIGGNGGLANGQNQDNSSVATGNVTGDPGGAGGNGGNIQFTLAAGAGVTSQGSAITALSQGGNGSPGGDGFSYAFGNGTGGQGGAGGDGGTVGFTVGAQNVFSTINRRRCRVRRHRCDDPALR